MYLISFNPHNSSINRNYSHRFLDEAIGLREDIHLINDRAKVWVSPEAMLFLL